MTARIIVTGNAATGPVVRVTRTGRRVANFRIGSTERYQDRETGDWVDGPTFFVGVACWGALADNVETSVKIGMALVVTGKIAQRTYTDGNDKVQFAYEIQAESVAPDLNRGTAVFTRVSRNSGPSVSVDEHGQPPMGVFDEPGRRAGEPTRRDVDAFPVHPDGTFGLAGDTELPCDDDGGPGSDRRGLPELVGASG